MNGPLRQNKRIPNKTNKSRNKFEDVKQFGWVVSSIIFYCITYFGTNEGECHVAHTHIHTLTHTDTLESFTHNTPFVVHFCFNFPFLWAIRLHHCRQHNITTARYYALAEQKKKSRQAATKPTDTVLSLSVCFCVSVCLSFGIYALKITIALW